MSGHESSGHFSSQKHIPAYKFSVEIPVLRLLERCRNVFWLVFCVLNALPRCLSGGVECKTIRSCLTRKKRGNMRRFMVNCSLILIAFARYFLASILSWQDVLLLLLMLLCELIARLYTPDIFSSALIFCLSVIRCICFETEA